LKVPSSEVHMQVLHLGFYLLDRLSRNAFLDEGALQVLALT
jgi:hypothetical protein